MTPNPKIGGAINLTIAVKGDLRTAYAAVEKAFATEDLPEGDELEGRPFVVRLVKVEVIEMTSLDPPTSIKRRWTPANSSLQAIVDTDPWCDIADRMADVILGSSEDRGQMVLADYRKLCAEDN